MSEQQILNRKRIISEKLTIIHDELEKLAAQKKELIESFEAGKINPLEAFLLDTLITISTLNFKEIFEEVKDEFNSLNFISECNLELSEE